MLKNEACLIKHVVLPAALTPCNVVAELIQSQTHSRLLSYCHFIMVLIACERVRSKGTNTNSYYLAPYKTQQQLV